MGVGLNNGAEGGMTNPVNAVVTDQLGEIGRQLDRCIFPVVKNGGYVLPRESTVFPKYLGMEPQNETARQRRSATESRPRPEGGPRPSNAAREPGRPRTPSEAAQVIGTSTESLYQGVLSTVCDAYPGAMLWDQGEGFWLYVESALLPELGRKVAFVIGISCQHKAVRGWGFWYDAILGATWIGARHTNFPDGSICAYDPADATWVYGDSLVELIDIYTVWAIRHLHLEYFGRWPGPQAVAYAYERLLEFSDQELCGCGTSGIRYKDCCKNRDLSRNRLAAAMQFGFFSGWSIRQPPEQIIQFVHDRKNPPRISEYT